MTKNEIVGRLKAGGLDASSTNRSAAVYVADARSGRAEPGWFAYRIVCDSEATGRRARAILSRWYDIDVNGNVWRLRSKNQVPLMAIKRGGVPPTPPTPTGDYLYFEAAQANSTVSLISMLATAPNLEYSIDGVTWQEWQHTTADGMHTFDTLTLTAVGDKVYLRGDNRNGISGSIYEGQVSVFVLAGKINAGGSITSLMDEDGVSMTTIPDNALTGLFCGGASDTLLTCPSFGNATSLGDGACFMMYTFNKSLLVPADMSKIASYGDGSCAQMYAGDIAMTSPASMRDAETVGYNAFREMYAFCGFAMSNNGTDFSFPFGIQFPFTTSSADNPVTYENAEQLAIEMLNVVGFGYSQLTILNRAYSENNITVNGNSPVFDMTIDLVGGESGRSSLFFVEMQQATDTAVLNEIITDYIFEAWQILENGNWTTISTDNPGTITLDNNTSQILRVLYQS